MFRLGSNNTKRPMAQVKRDTRETESTTYDAGLSSFAKDTVNKVGQNFSDIGKGMFDQLLGSYQETSEKQKPQEQAQNQESEAPKLENKTLFSFQDMETRRQIEQMKELIKQIKQEVDAIKRADSSMMSEVNDIENLTINNLPDKPGIYHIRFLEVVLKVLQTLRMKVSESGTWLQAMNSKKKKRGSAFAARSKKAGTQYSMSQELSNARSVQ